MSTDTDTEQQAAKEILQRVIERLEAKQSSLICTALGDVQIECSSAFLIRSIVVPTLKERVTSFLQHYRAAVVEQVIVRRLGKAALSPYYHYGVKLPALHAYFRDLRIAWVKAMLEDLETTPYDQLTTDLPNLPLPELP